MQDKPFKPYIPADKITPELTVTSILVGVILAVVFGAANAYLGLRVGLTVSASIPSAVLAMGIIRVLMRRNSILESNMVQTIGSAGESLAAGAIFTLPALFLWAAEGLGEKPGLVEITVIALCGGLLGVFFMVPLRNALIVREHATLPYPEGTACADVLLAGEKGLRVYLLGAKEEVVSALAEKLQGQYPQMEVRYQNGYSKDKDADFAKIEAWQPDLTLVALGVPALRIICFSFLLAGINVICSSTFQALGRGMLALWTSIARQLVVLVPVAWLLSLTGNLDLVWLAFPIAEIVSLILSPRAPRSPGPD